MAERKLTIGKLQIVLFRSNRKTMLPLLAVIVLTAAALGALYWAEFQITRQTAFMRDEAAQVTYENSILNRNINELGSVKSTERIAQEELGLVSASTTLIEAQVN